MTPLNTESSSPTRELAGGSLELFAETAEAVAATTKKLEKAALLGQYFKRVSDDDLARAARFFAGQHFAAHDSRTTNVGGRVISDALAEATGFTVAELLPRYVRLGDAGELAHELVLEARGNQGPPEMSLAETEALIESLSETRGKKNKTVLLTSVLRRATPLEAKYLIKLLVSDLRIGLREGLVEDAIARAFDRKLTEVATANMLLGDIGETARRARANELGGIEMRLFHPIKFMLATPAVDLADIARTMPEQFFVEDKFDGIRAQAHVTRDRVAIYSRTMDEITHRFPELISPLMSLPTDAIIDGEIIPARGDQILPFSELQKRLGRKTASAELLQETPVILVAYDLLFANGQVLIDEALRYRLSILRNLIGPQEALRISEAKLCSDVATLDEEFAAARARDNEGLMIKSPASTYSPGRRGREWLKLKRAIATLDVVVTAVEVGHGKRRNLLSDYTFAVRRSPQDPELLNIGKAYSGLTDAELSELTEWFRAHTIQQFAHGRVRLVEPKVVLEVAFDKIQESKRHKSGFAMRFPRIVRLRPDKLVDEIDTLETVERLVKGLAERNSAQVPSPSTE